MAKRCHSKARRITKDLRHTLSTSHMGKDMDVLILARRFTIITLFAAIFAVSFSAAVNRNAGGGAQSHFGANYTCLDKNSPLCTAMN
jgi:hypothetical protein